MINAEFDQFADEYEAMHNSVITVSGESAEFFAEYKVRDIRKLWMRLRRLEEPATIVDFGCGVASSLPFFRSAFPESRIICLDVSRRCLDLAARRFAGMAEFVHFDGNTIPLPSMSVDIVFAACVFHHIDHSEHVHILQEFRRLLTANGLGCVFEHNPFNPLTRRTVNSCPFDSNAQLISARAMKRRFREAGFGTVRANYRFFFPNLLRRCRVFEPWLAWCPLGAQYFVVGHR